MSSFAEQVHARFRGANEISKSAMLVALLLDVFAGFLASLGIFAVYKPPWTPLILFFAALLGALFRAFGKSVRSYAQRCRRLALRAYCLGEEIDPLTESDTRVEVPHCAEWIATKLPAKSLREYYDPKCPPGEPRLRELYAHSAFFTWRLLRIKAWLTTVLGTLLCVAAFIVIYDLAISPRDEITRSAIVEALCTVVLVVFCVRSIEATAEAIVSTKEARAIERKLLRTPVGHELADIVDEYDVERAAGAVVPTTFYLLRRGSLKRDWHARRQALLDC